MGVVGCWVELGCKFQIRGSSALFDACASVFVFEGEKEAPTKVHHHKDRNRGTCVESFGIDSQDVSQEHDAKWGLRVLHLNAEQMQDENKHDAIMRQLRARVLEVVSRSPGISGRRIRAECGGKGIYVDAVLEEFEQNGRLLAEDGPKRARLYRVRGDA
jgi:hypothetical protein